MSSKNSTIWAAEPHTIAKIEMLRSYLYQWFSILGTTFKGKDLWYIDGFAGPGEYTNYAQGSPLAALNAAEEAMMKAGPRWAAGDIHCLFIEEDEARFKHLKRKLDEIAAKPRIFSRSFHGKFVDGHLWLKGELKNPFTTSNPVFAFIDPFGPRGLSFKVVKDLLSRRACEVLVNLDSDGVSRIYRAGDNANHRELLNDVFGGDAWERELAGVPQQEAVRRVVALYKKSLRSLPDVKYTFSFEMRKKSDIFDYHLVFASQHAKGLERMKEVMKKIDKSGSYCFSDGDFGQQHLFTFDDPAVAADQLFKHFSGSTIDYSDINTYALNESPFPNPKSMLNLLERAGRILVNSGGQQRMKNTFPDRLHDVIRVSF